MFKTVRKSICVIASTFLVFTLLACHSQADNPVPDQTTLPSETTVVMTTTAPITTVTTTQTTTTKIASEIVIPESVTYGKAYAVLECSRLKIKKDIYFGDDAALLKTHVGQYPDSVLIGDVGVALIAGHNGSQFQALKNIKEGDIFTVTTDYGVFKYEVDSTEIRAAESFMADELMSNDHRMFIYTCYPFNSYSTPDRFFVYTTLIESSAK